MEIGLSITVLGMSIVFAFIALLSFAIYLLSKLQSKAATGDPSSAELVAVISAALHMYRSQSRSVERRE